MSISIAGKDGSNVVVVVDAGTRVEGGLEVLEAGALVVEAGGVVVDEAVVGDGAGGPVVVVAARAAGDKPASRLIAAAIASPLRMGPGRDRPGDRRIHVVAQRGAAWRRNERMAGLRVGVEVEATADAVTAATATLPWMEPERIALGDHRYLVLLGTSFVSADEARVYAERRLRKSATAMNLEIRIVSTEAFPPVIDLRDTAPRRMSDDHHG